MRRVAIADVSKNIYATYRACRRAKLDIACVADGRPAFAGTEYRGIPVLPEDRACGEPVDGVVVSNINPAQVDRRVAELEGRFKGPVLRLWHPRWIESPSGEKGPSPVTEPGAGRAKEPPPAGQERGLTLPRFAIYTREVHRWSHRCYPESGRPSRRRRSRTNSRAAAATALPASSSGSRRCPSASGRPLPVRWDDRQPCLDDRTITCGFDRHYVYHTAWAARVPAATRPARHVDISSSLYFCSIVSAFLPVEYYEYRPGEPAAG